MLSFLKKSTSLILVISSLAFAGSAVFSLEEVNQKVANFTAPYNRPDSSMNLTFTALEGDAVRALKFGVNFLVEKKRGDNHLSFAVKDVSYDYANGNPHVIASAALKFDFIKVLGQDALNQFAVILEPVAEGMILDYGKKYGEALKVDVAMEELKRDTDGNVVSAKMKAKLSLDYSLLPQNIAISDVEFKSLTASISANRDEVKALLEATLNPDYKRFYEDEVGLKELIENFLNDDQETYEGLESFVLMFDRFGDMVLDRLESNALDL